MVATAHAAADHGPANDNSAVDILQEMETQKEIRKMPVGLQADLVQHALDEAQAAAERRAAVAALRGRKASEEGHVDLLAAAADLLWGAVEAQPEVAFHPRTAPAASAVPAAEPNHALLLGMQRALRECQTLVSPGEAAQPAPQMQQARRQPRRLGALKEQLQQVAGKPPGCGSQPQHLATVHRQQQQAPMPVVLPLLSTVLPAPADSLLPSAALAATEAAAALPTQVATTAQRLAGMNLSAEVGAAMAGHGSS